MCPAYTCLSLGLGAVCAQEHQSKDHPVMFLNQRLFPIKQKEATVEKKALVIKWAIVAHPLVSCYESCH